jgi:hypothetical protein
MTEGPSAAFLSGLDPGARAIAERVIAAIPADLTTAVKWRQLTFAVDGDYDHWICAVSATKNSAALILHYGSLLDRDVFDPSDAKYTRRITYRSPDEVEATLIEAVVAAALDALPRFRQATERGKPL